MKIRTVRLSCFMVAMFAFTTTGFSATRPAFADAYNATTFRGTSSIPYNSNNQRTSTNFSYDGNGNCTELNNVDCYYDNLNRLTVYEPFHSGTNSYWNTAYNYCGDGLMGERAKHVYNYNNGLWVETDSAPTNIYNLDGHPDG